MDTPGEDAEQELRELLAEEEKRLAIGFLDAAAMSPAEEATIRREALAAVEARWRAENNK